MLDFEEAARLDALYQLRLLDTSSSESFDRITRMASQIFGLPVAAVSLTDRDRQWFKSRVGIDHSSIPRDRAPCAQVAISKELLVIEDLSQDACYADSVLGRSGTRFYAGAPLITRDGYGLGSLCVLGTEPRKASPAELAALIDLSAMVMAQIELQHAFGRIDPISGLATRSQFHEDLVDLAHDRPGEQRFAVVVDLARGDQLGRITRVMGAARVDELIREGAVLLRKTLGPTMPAYHVGAAQFAFLSPPGVGQAVYMERLENAFEALRATTSVRFVTHVALGVRPFILGDVPPDDVLRGAASAAQDARQAGRSIALYSFANDAAQRRQYRLLRDFGVALEVGNQLRLVYQPRIELATGRCIGAEALLRWQHPRLGDVSPAEFIPIIEQTALTRPTTAWVLDAALDRLADWQALAIPIALSINISCANLCELDLIARIETGLKTRNLPPDRLEIELTESAIMDKPDQALKMLRDMSAAGIRLAIDDFGTGHSSLAYMQRLPAQVLKIDRTFVCNLTEASGPDFLLVEAIVGLAHKMGYRVVAEGIETPEAAAVLTQIGCEDAQGFLFARPMEADQFVRWLWERNEQPSERYLSAAI